MTPLLQRMLPVAAVLWLAACGGSWQASFIWDGRDKNDDGSNLVIIITELRWSSHGSRPAWQPVGQWQTPIARAPIALRSRLAQLTRVDFASCRSDLPAYELIIPNGSGRARYLSDHAACAGASGLAPGDGYIEQMAFEDMVNILRQER
ncbi:hypothetical protein AAV94_00475 [Lampropedia cohaerens]|uniref:Lipoprotein n=1 Tax=Lampropedia cohaerens TaxID=1610491 RepID=A0A0U1Q3C4_9BURK|nr:hypothetical protein [Lampropedia cohaerens]KKW69246.1 hypothetical protein AAV94_00475 [Lampropedia cohaerens]